MASNGSGVTDPTKAPHAVSEAVSKGKGKATEDDTMRDAGAPAHDDDDDDDDDEEDDGAEIDEEDNDDDDLQEIDLENVMGRRTRGRVIDFAKAAAENPAVDEDDEDDDDFEDPDNNDTKMDED